MEPLRAILDANVLFSSAVGGPGFELLWSLAASGRLALLTSRTCVVEAERNQDRKRPDAIGHLDARMRAVQIVPDVTQEVERVDLPPKDAPIYAAAVESGADVFSTGDLRHFGALMRRADAPVPVRTVRAFLSRPSE
jgi:predicted nucleic acid-binding protein